MEQLPLWLTPALVLGMFVWLRVMIRDLKENVNARMKELSGRMSELSDRVDETNRRIDSVAAETNRRIDKLVAETNQRFDHVIAEMNRRFEVFAAEMHKRFDEVHRVLGENRERMAKLEGSLEGFLAGRRDRDAA